MYIEEIRLANIRGYRTHEIVTVALQRPSIDEGSLTVLAGRNGSGKSTFLRAVALALMGPSVARSLMPSFSDWISEGANYGLVQVSYKGDAEDKISGGGAPAVKRTWTGLRWDRENTGNQPVMKKYLPPKAPAGAPERGPWADNPKGWFIAGYGPFRRLTGAGAEAQRLMLGNPRTAAVATLFDETASLAEATWWLQDIYPRVLERQEQYVRLQQDAFQMLNDGLMPDGARVVDYDSNGLWVEQQDTRLLIESLSDGYRVAAALVLDIVRRCFQAYGDFKLVKREDGSFYCPNSGVVLIDELDVHLHVSWQKDIGYWLRRHFPAIQFIVSTHSPFICQAASSRGLIRLPAPNESKRTPERISEELEKRIKNSGADEAVLSELFGLDSTLSWEAQHNRDNLVDLEVNGRIKEAEELAQDIGLSMSAEVSVAIRSLAEKLAQS